MVILFSHPADFTPVCTSEFMTFASMQEVFRDYNCELVGLSVDGLYSHIAWLRTIKERITFRDMKDVEVTFPLIDDVSMTIARQYGMIMPGEDTAKTVRAVFIIDPVGVIRTIVYYPLSTGRNIPELLRVVKALQTADRFDVATPADWRPGEAVIVSPAGSCGTAKERMAVTDGSVHCEDWFFCQQDLDEASVDAAIRAGGADMCSPVRCRECGKLTWSGCGRHVDAVMAGVPADKRCSCEPEVGRGSLLRALSRRWQ